jgi:signal transduction histidine kinase
VEVAYNTEMPELDEGPFLLEERNLIDAIAREISIIIERMQVEEEKENLQEQLRHADRLATIGQLAAGVAHELNEPLGSILGFAQLIKKDLNNPQQIMMDVNKIESASLHAREVIKKLMIFSRQSPQKKSPINLDRIVEEGLYFLESRCAKADINLIKELDGNLPDFVADKSQLYQILVNLVVNSIQAMPDGGTINIKTSHDETNVILSVKDSGLGIEEDILNKIFIPFFTTKDIDEGTGLGLAVVHGIVTSHGGLIKVESKPGEGTVFNIYLPISHGDKDEQINK